MYEGYPSYYIKETVNVILDNGEVKNAIVYVMTDNQKGVNPPMNSYFKCIYDGYVVNGIDTECLYNALKCSFSDKTEYNEYKMKEMI
jgi:cation transport regulator ChaC